MKRNNKRLLSAVLVFLIVINTVVACSSKTAHEKQVRSMSNGVVAQEDATMAATNAEYIAEENLSGGYETGDIINEAPVPETPDSIPAGNMLIRTVTMTIATENFDDLAALIRTSVSEYGGYFQNMTISGTGTVNDYKRGTFVIRVPADNLDTLTAALDGNGTLISSNETTEDVTLDYVDIESHLAALRAEQESLMTLLEEADDLDTIVQLEGYLTNIRYEIENYESQARTMSNLVEYSTLTINLQEVVTEEPPVEIDEVREETLKTRVSKAFSDSWSRVKEDGKDLIVSFAGSFPVVTVRLIVLGFFFLIGYGTFKIIKKRKAKKVALAKPADTPADKS